MNYNHLSFLTVDEQIEIREKIHNFKPNTPKEYRDKEILEMYFIDGYTARDIEALKSVKAFSGSGKEQARTINSRTVNYIVDLYFPGIMKKRRKPETFKSKRIKHAYEKTTIIKRDFNPQMCCRCGRFDDIDMHHMIPQDLGGLSVSINLMPLCESCHTEYTIWYRKNKKRILLDMIQSNYEFLENFFRDKGE